MKRMFSKPLTLLVAAVLLTTGWIGGAELMRLDVQPQSKIRVEGTSSMHDWTCEVKAFTGSFETTPSGAQPASALEALSRAQVTIPTSNLECKNGTMNKKALDALKAKQNPTIQYSLKSAQVVSEGSDGWATLKASGQLKIAGVEKPVTMTVKGKKVDEGFRFTGSTPLLMSDFGIAPPTAMLGAMKTGDAITIHFDVVAR